MHRALLVIVLCAAVAIHWRRQLVYFSTSRDRVHRIALNATGQQQPAEVVYQAGSRAGGAGLRLSVDWLYDRLYVADQNAVSLSRAPACCHGNRPRHACLRDVCCLRVFASVRASLGHTSLMSLSLGVAKRFLFM